jgi:hypothetical protein
MKNRVTVFATLAFCVCLFLQGRVVAAQEAGAAPGAAQGPASEKLEKLSQVLNLSPTQKSQLAPILQAEAPKLQAIKDNPSLSGREKKKQLKAIHSQADPQVKAILNPTQYQQWESIRKDEIDQVKEEAK